MSACEEIMRAPVPARSSRMPGDPARPPSGPFRVPALFLTALSGRRVARPSSRRGAAPTHQRRHREQARSCTPEPAGANSFAHRLHRGGGAAPAHQQRHREAGGWRDLHRGGAPLLHTSDVIADAEGWGDAPASSRMPGDPARHPSGPLRVPALFLTALWAEGWRGLHRGEGVSPTRGGPPCMSPSRPHHFIGAAIGTRGGAALAPR